MNIRKIIKEVIDDLEWAKEAVNLPTLPEPSPPNRYVLRFALNTPVEIFEWVSNELLKKGWKRSQRDGQILDEELMEELLNYNRTSAESYINLRPNGTISIGRSNYGFKMANDIDMDSVPNIFITQ